MNHFEFCSPKESPWAWFGHRKNISAISNFNHSFSRRRALRLSLVSVYCYPATKSAHDNYGGGLSAPSRRKVHTKMSWVLG